MIDQNAVDATNDPAPAPASRCPARTQQNDTVPEGEVFDQDPKGNAKADEGSTVQIIVSGGVGKVEVPDVTS